MNPDCALSVNEQIKLASDGLRGTIAQELELPQLGFSRENAHLLKFHGIFQQDDRDVRLQRRWDGLEADVEFTARVRATGGRLTIGHILGLLDLIDEFHLGPLRLTSRQGLQLSQLRKSHLREAVVRIARLGLTTFSSAGDVNCNVMCCPASGDGDDAGSTLFRLARQIDAMLMPDAAVYRSLWLSGDSQTRSTPAIEAPEQNGIYGPTFLPHKLKIGLALPEDNCVDVYAQDIGLMMRHRDGRVEGYEVLVGGGMSMMPSVPRNSPRLAQPLAFVSPSQILEVIRAIVEVYRDFGDRSRQRQARLKYLVADRGLEDFERLVESRLGWKLPEPRGIEVTGRRDHLGWHSHSDGSMQLGLLIESGRLQDGSQGRMASALRSILQRFRTDVRLTPQQNLLLSGVKPSDQNGIDSILADCGISPATAISGVRRRAMSCPALPSCRRAITEAERIVPELLAAIESELRELGLADEECSICVTGCSHGCARCYLADIALVGRTMDKRTKVHQFAIYLGGDPLGRRLNRLYQDLVPRHQVIPVLRSLLDRFRQERRHQETLSTFLCRVADDVVATVLSPSDILDAGDDLDASDGAKESFGNNLPNAES